MTKRILFRTTAVALSVAISGCAQDPPPRSYAVRSIVTPRYDPPTYTPPPPPPPAPRLRPTADSSPVLPLLAGTAIGGAGATMMSKKPVPKIPKVPPAASTGTAEGGSAAGRIAANDATAIGEGGAAMRGGAGGMAEAEVGGGALDGLSLGAGEGAMALALRLIPWVGAAYIAYELMKNDN